MRFTRILIRSKLIPRPPQKPLAPGQEPPPPMPNYSIVNLETIAEVSVFEDDVVTIRFSHGGTLGMKGQPARLLMKALNEIADIQPEDATAARIEEIELALQAIDAVEASIEKPPTAEAKERLDDVRVLLRGRLDEVRDGETEER